MSTTWDIRYLELAEQISSWSKDPSTKCGAVIIGSKRQVVSSGYNGFPRGVTDTSERLNERSTKYQYVVHAEMNAIYNAAHTGTSLDGATIFIHGLPCCAECAKGIIQTGIRRVVMPSRKKVSMHWAESWTLASQMLSEAGVTWDFIEITTDDE